VLVSYAHDSGPHREAVRDLWILLRECGIDARIDRTAAEQPQDWAQWMLEQVREADFVLVVASPAYRRRAEGTEEAGIGLGVQWEARLIRDAFYADGTAARRRFLPVLLPGGSVADIPAFFGTMAGTHYQVAEFSQSGIERLLRVLTGQPFEVDIPLGEVPRLAPRAAEPTAAVVVPAGGRAEVDAPAVAGRSITLLHLSDIQFGRNHVFAGAGLTAADQHFDSLFARLHDDLLFLRDRESLTPDLVVVSGDLAEWGMGKELDHAERFIAELTGRLGLSRRRVVIVPGNHDVNRWACEAYFNQCAADDTPPQAPYWPKWQHFAAMFERFYSGERSIRFAPERPYTLFEMPDLELVVAGLNSTMAESHLETDHYGWTGEAQLRWFAEELREFERRGWLRIGVVHHNVLRGAQDDEENLRDAGDLERILAPRLDLLLHGHTHNARLGRLATGLVVLSTGSAALKRGSRPPDVPNQYQVLRIEIEAGRIRRWARRYEPDQKRWTGDNRVSDDGGDWRAVIPARLSVAG
jgi:3',5'-cyclic AMP phosphodiesterase CpdA